MIQKYVVSRMTKEEEELRSSGVGFLKCFFMTKRNFQYSEINSNVLGTNNIDLKVRC